MSVVRCFTAMKIPPSCDDFRRTHLFPRRPDRLFKVIAYREIQQGPTPAVGDGPAAQVVNFSENFPRQGQAIHSKIKGLDSTRSLVPSGSGRTTRDKMTAGQLR